MSTRVQLLCAWCVPVGVAVILIGFWPVAGYIPPPRADDTALQIATFYRDHTVRIRLGLLLSFAGCAVWGPLTAVITRQMQRMRPGERVLSYTQLAAGTAAWVFLLAPLLILTVAAFRPERSPEATQTIHDLGWFLLIMPFVPFVVQLFAIGSATLRDTGATPVFPRWVGYFNIWVAVLFMPGGLITFFKTGPFSYHGILAFWIPVFIFFVWMLVMPPVLHRAILAEARE